MGGNFTTPSSVRRVYTDDQGREVVVTNRLSGFTAPVESVLGESLGPSDHRRLQVRLFALKDELKKLKPARIANDRVKMRRRGELEAEREMIENQLALIEAGNAQVRAEQDAAWRAAIAAD